MPVYKMTWFFRQQATGWSESWYVSQPSEDISAVSGYLETYADKRFALMGKQGNIPYARITKIGTPNRSLVVHLENYDNPLTYAVESSDFAATSLLVKFSTVGAANSKNLYLRGNPDDAVQNAGTYTPQADWLTAYRAWTRFIFQNSFGWLGKDSNTQGNVLDVNQTPETPAVIIVTNDFFPANQVNTHQVVRFKNVGGSSQLNGQQTVIVTQRNGCTTLRTFPVFPFTAGGFIVVKNSSVKVAALQQVMRVVERKAGRPFGQSRGRAPNRLRA